MPDAVSIDLMFRAFSDRTRLRILYLLQSGECCVGNLVEILGVEQPSASRHLAYLRRAGLVSVRKDRTVVLLLPGARLSALPPEVAGVPEPAASARCRRFRPTRAGPGNPGVGRMLPG